MTKISTSLAIFLCTLTAACGDEAIIVDAGPKNTVDGGTPDASIDGSPGGSVNLTPPRDGFGKQITLETTLAANFETERCAFWRAPAEGMNIVREEINYTPGSHHAVLWMTAYQAVPTKDLAGTDVDTSKTFDCGGGVFGVWNVTGMVAVHQTATGPSTVDGLPPGTALKVPGNALLLVNIHYLNASPKPIDTKLAMNLHTIPDAEVKQEAGILFLYNPFINVPAMGTATARMQCPVNSDLTLVNTQSHMHARGVGYVANVLDPVNKTSREVYSGTEWAEVVARKLEPAAVVKAGNVFDFKCSYQNNSTRAVNQGFTTNDEMCVLWGLYYPRDLKTEYCSLNGDFSGIAFGGNWVGDGTKGGAESAACLQAATAKELYSCVTNSCPKISPEVSNAARCLATKGLKMCAADCDADPAACKACVAKTCAGYMQILGAATCQ